MTQLPHTAWLAALTIAAVGAIAQPAGAAPFCLKNQVLSPQCMYYDAQQCAREAGRQGAECVVNPAEVRMTQGGSEYCVVTSAQVAVCAYADRQNCAQAAARQHGTCTQATPGPARTPNPYSPINGQ